MIWSTLKNPTVNLMQIQKINIITAKGEGEQSQKGALESFQIVLYLENGKKGEWGFKTMKQMIKINFRLKNSLAYIKSTVTRNHSKKSIRVYLLRGLIRYYSCHLILVCQSHQSLPNSSPQDVLCLPLQPSTPSHHFSSLTMSQFPSQASFCPDENNQSCLMRRTLTWTS